MRLPPIPALLQSDRYLPTDSVPDQNALPQGTRYECVPRPIRPREALACQQRRSRSVPPTAFGKLSAAPELRVKRTPLPLPPSAKRHGTPVFTRLGTDGATMFWTLLKVPLVRAGGVFEDAIPLLYQEPYGISCLGPRRSISPNR